MQFPNFNSPLFSQIKILILLIIFGILFIEIYLEKFPEQNFGETTSCVTIILVIKFKCHCLIRVVMTFENIVTSKRFL